MFADSESSTHSLTPTSSFIDDSILDDPQPHPEEQTSPDSAVFEKKWIVTDVGSSGSESMFPFQPALSPYGSPCTFALLLNVKINKKL
jgi:hypothetical protein